MLTHLGTDRVIGDPHMTIPSQSTKTLQALQSIILKRIDDKKISHQEILKLIGYRHHPKTHDKALKRLQRVLSAPKLGLVNTTYDFKYSSSEFVQKLCIVLEIDKKIYQPLLSDIEQHASQVLNAITPIVYADVAFNESFTPSFMSFMAVDRFKRIALANEVKLLSRQQQLDVIHKKVIEHYDYMQGKIPYDGHIKGYRIIFDRGTDMSEVLYIDTDSLAEN